MNRRGFLGSMLALGMAPAIVRAESLMRIKAVVLPGEAEFVAIDNVINPLFGRYEGIRLIHTPPLWADALFREVNKSSLLEGLLRRAA